jgi:c-type cytochrome biogenesis protein CcmF
LAAWVFLTLGIAMGSYWAYYTLGWGGFWFWDPVENASLMPWLAGTALLHSAVVMEKRNALKIWTILLAILTFSLSLVGTFLVRSGVLTSVHTFATDPTRGVFILAILVLFIGGGLTLFAWRASTLKQGGLFAPISREGALVFNNLFLTTACLTVFVGTLYPLALEAVTDEKISVGAPFFNLTFGPLFVALMFVIPFGPLLAWKRGDLLGVAQRLMTAFVIGITAVAITFAIKGSHSILTPFGVGLALFVMLGALTDLVERNRLSACHRIATLDLGHCDRALWRCYVHAWHYLCGYLGHGTHHRGETNSDRFAFGLRVFLRRASAEAGSELQRAGGKVHRAKCWGAGWYYGAIEAQLLRTRHDDQRGGVDVAWAGPTLSVARR